MTDSIQTDHSPLIEALSWASLTTLRCERDLPIVFYHGSSERDIETFDHGTTAYGIFFAEDYATASYYTGEDGRVYAVLLDVQNVADLDDPDTFDKVAREAVDYTEVRNDDEARDFASRLFRDGYYKNDTVRQFFDRFEYLQEVDDDYTIQDLLRLERIGASEIEELVDEINREHIRAAFDADVPAKFPELEAAREAYRTDAFYLTYQDDLMHAAQNMGYDCVVFTDPSSTGHPCSHVVFSPDRIFILDEAAAEQLIATGNSPVAKQQP